MITNETMYITFSILFLITSLGGYGFSAWLHTEYKSWQWEKNKTDKQTNTKVWKNEIPVIQSAKKLARTAGSVLHKATGWKSMASY